MPKHLAWIAFLSARALYGWGCDGHQMVALIAEANLTPHARQRVDELLRQNPVDPQLIRFCINNHDDLMADASTWADDVRHQAGGGDGGARWHYIDVPRQAAGGDVNRWCEPVGPAVEKGDRKGCVFSAISYFRDRLADPQIPGPDRAQALRYLIHFIGDLHQPLHAADNLDNGGNCAPMALMDSATISNLHSLWDSGLIDEHLKAAGQTAAQYAAKLNRRFQSQKPQWAGSTDISAWVWESHALANRVAYGALEPPIPLEPSQGRTDCAAESLKVYALRIHPGQAYLDEAVPVIDQQLTRAGFRLAALLNVIFP